VQQRGVQELSVSPTITMLVTTVCNCVKLCEPPEHLQRAHAYQAQLINHIKSAFPEVAPEAEKETPTDISMRQEVRNIVAPACK